MSQKEIDRIVAEFRETVCDINDGEVAAVVNLCMRKIKLTGQPVAYMELLLPDELKNYVFRRAVNATTILRQIEKRCAECAVCV